MVKSISNPLSNKSTKWIPISIKSYLIIEMAVILINESPQTTLFPTSELLWEFITLCSAFQHKLLLHLWGTSSQVSEFWELIASYHWGEISDPSDYPCLSEYKILIYCSCVVIQARQLVLTGIFLKDSPEASRRILVTER